MCVSEFVYFKRIFFGMAWKREWERTGKWNLIHWLNFDFCFLFSFFFFFFFFNWLNTVVRHLASTVAHFNQYSRTNKREQEKWRITFVVSLRSMASVCVIHFTQLRIYIPLREIWLSAVAIYDRDMLSLSLSFHFIRLASRDVLKFSLRHIMLPLNY